MRRRLSTVASALSILLCTATLALWARSYFAIDCLFWSSFIDQGRWVLWKRTFLFIGAGGCAFRRQTSLYIDCGNAIVNSPRPVDAGSRYFLSAFPLRLLKVPTYPEFAAAKPAHSLCGFNWTRFSSIPAGARPIDDSSELVIPMWSIALISIPFPAALALRWRRRRHRLKSGLCPACGYDLAANTTGVCPECGTVVTNGARR